MDSFTGVVVVGAGPTGLMLAGDLARAGVSCTVLERRAEETNLTRAFAVHARTLEMLDARGLADDLVTTGRRVGALRLFGKLEVDLSRLPTRFPYVLVTPQYHTERVLEEHASALGAQIVRGAEVVDLRQDNDGVELDVRYKDGTLGTRRAMYAIGADGVHSKVRQALALPFPGHSAIQSVMLADVQLSEAPEDVLTVNAARDGFIFIAPFGDGWYRVIAWDRRRELPDHAPVELEEIREIAWRVLGTDYGMHDPRWMSRFHSDERQVPHYRVGRVFLAGDAAHCHSPAGGQGMNTGLQDAANLGWKLAAALQGWAPGGVLDSYHAERYPGGRAVEAHPGPVSCHPCGALAARQLLRPVWLASRHSEPGGFRHRHLICCAPRRAPPGRTAGARCPVGVRGSGADAALRDLAERQVRAPHTRGRRGCHRGQMDRTGRPGDPRRRDAPDGAGTPGRVRRLGHR